MVCSHGLFLLISVFMMVVSGATQAADDSSTDTLKPKDDGYRGIWFTLGQYTDAPYGKGSWKSFWDYGDKYSGGLGTYTAKHEPIAIYAPAVRKTFFCYGGSKKGERYLYNMISYYDHEKDRVPKPTIVHDKQGVNDPHDNATLAIDEAGHIWVYVAGRGRIRPGFVYKSIQPYDIDRFERISSDEICYPQPHAIPGEGIVELFTKYTNGRELYWNLRQLDGSRGEDQKLAGMEGQYQTSYHEGTRVITAFNRHPQHAPDRRTDLYYLETRDLGKTWQTVDGIPITPPLVDPKNPALVKAYSDDHRLVYMKSITLDKDGNPVILVVTSSDHRPGPQGDPRNWEVLHYKHNQWNIRHVTTSTHNYDTGSIWVEANGTWRVAGPTEPGPQCWGGGGEVAVWTSRDQGKTWNKARDVTRNSPRNHSYVRRVSNADPESPFAFLWADGHPDKLSISRLYFANRDGTHVRQLPYDMEEDFATPKWIQVNP
ncbi:MAG: BNR-4 repeat-containing protein [Pirellulales bacterium]|nr:BNR-4 repeat-containing protein [Pirellulales bacterium]